MNLADSDNALILPLLVIFLGAALAPWLYRSARRATPWLLALLPLATLGYLISTAQMVADGMERRATLRWAPSLGVNLSVRLDGLAWLMALLITGIGVCIVIYAGGYWQGRAEGGRFFAFLLLFMGAMLGVVLADNIILLFIFWEMTSLSSYLLIGFKHETEKAQKAALQALLVTGSGGLALLAGLILLARIAGSWELASLLSQGQSLQTDPLFPAAMLLILAGAFTKSAQFPFHFWLPNAMAGPTPVSAYLHSATMVKAGVYLLARLQPIMAGYPLWTALLTTTGLLTLAVGAWLAWQQTDLKRLLAYSTVAALGALVLLIGIGTELALKSVPLFLLAHALYKGALFMAVGNIDLAAGSLDVRRLRGVGRAMPWTSVGLGLAGLSLVGLPPLPGFLAKEYLYDALWHAPLGAVGLTSLALLANIGLGAAAWLALLRPIFGRKSPTSPAMRETAPSLWFGPLALGLAALMVGLMSPLAAARWLWSPAASSLTGAPLTAKFSLAAALSQISPVLLLSIATVVGSLGLWLQWERWQPGASRLAQRLGRIGPERAYEVGLSGILAFSRRLTHTLQTGRIRHYLLWVFGLLIVGGGYALFGAGPLLWPRLQLDARAYELLLVVMILTATALAVGAPSRLTAVAALGVVGYSLALVYVVFGAPDLAMTQFAVESLSVIVLVLVLYRLPRFARLSRPGARLRDAGLALAVGALMAGILLAAAALPATDHVSDFYLAQSVTQANGRNIVNVILVDFRALDTLGEIAVLTIAASGIFALVRRGRIQQRARTGEAPDSSDAAP